MTTMTTNIDKSNGGWPEGTSLDYALNWNFSVAIGGTLSSQICVAWKPHLQLGRQVSIMLMSVKKCFKPWIYFLNITPVAAMKTIKAYRSIF